ncbi:hypothetical protein GCM10022205_24600 [Spinactinospora alkalitolerans]
MGLLRRWRGLRWGRALRSSDRPGGIGKAACGPRTPLLRGCSAGSARPRDGAPPRLKIARHLDRQSHGTKRAWLYGNERYTEGDAAWFLVPSPLRSADTEIVSRRGNRIGETANRPDEEYAVVRQRRHSPLRF